MLTRTKTLLILKLLLVFICLCFAVSFLFSKDKITAAEALWQQTKNTNTLLAYQDYLNKHPADKYSHIATENIIRFKQDTLNYEKAIDAGTYQALQYYTDNCEKNTCASLEQASKTLDTADRISQDFKYHLRIKNLSTGSKGYALADIDSYKKILPYDNKVEVWYRLVGENFINLAQKSLNKNNLKQAAIYTAKAKIILEKKQTKKIDNLITLYSTQETEIDTSDMKKNNKKINNKAQQKKIENALLTGDINFISSYIKDCANCPLIEKAKTKLKSYEIIHKDFKLNLAINRLTKGNISAAANLEALKNLFKKSEQAPIWAQEISDKFYTLASTEKDSAKSMNYINTGLTFAVNADKLNALKTTNTSKLSTQQAYKNMQQAKTIKSAEDYINNCQPDNCLDYEKINSDLTKVKSIQKNFNQHLSDTNLTKGNNGFALEGIYKLEALFKNEPMINKWKSLVVDKFLTLINEAMERKNHALARKYLTTAFSIQKNNAKLKTALAKLIVVNPKYNIDIKNIVPATLITESSEVDVPNKQKIENALLIGDIDFISTYIKDCADCPLMEKAKTKLKSYEIIHKDFKLNLASNRLTKGNISAAANLEALKSLFKKSKQAPIWAQEISDKFYTLASTEKDSAKLMSYINTGLTFAVNADKLNSLKPNDTSKLSTQQAYKNMQQAKTIKSAEDYINNCQPDNCLEYKKINSNLAKAKSIQKDFKQHLSDTSLTKGNNGFALNDINKLEKLFKKEPMINKWKSLVIDKFLSLIKSAMERKNYALARKYLTTAFSVHQNNAKLKTALARLILVNPKYHINIKNIVPATLITESSEVDVPDKHKIENALLTGDINFISTYIKDCANCPLMEKAKTKLKSYENIHKDFKLNLASNRLTKGNISAAANLEALKSLFKKSEQAPIWAQEISDKFYTLASTEKNSVKSMNYINAGLTFAVKADKLNSLKSTNTSKLSTKQIYKNMQQAKTIKSAEDYIDNCQPDNCLDYKKINSNLAKAKSIQKDFKQHLNDTSLTKGNNGFALNDINKLEKLFKKEPMINKWKSLVIDKFLSLINEAMERKNHALARKYLTAAFIVQKNNTKLKTALAKLTKANPKYSAYIKGSKLVPAMVYLPAKKFFMGGQFKKAKPKHTVNIKHFRISTHEISFQKYVKFARATRTKINSNGWGLGSRPAINVSWRNAVNYSKWLSKKTGRKFRLPSEAEWEYAASKSKVLNKNAELNIAKTCQYANGADKNSNFPWKNRKCKDGYSSSTAPVTSFKPNTFGLYNTLGNVWEWTYDCWHYNFKGAPKNSKAWTKNGDCRYRVIKGGGWNSSTDFMSPKYRTSAKAEVRYNYVGFRIVEDL